MAIDAATERALWVLETALARCDLARCDPRQLLAPAAREFGRSGRCYRREEMLAAVLAAPGPRPLELRELVCTEVAPGVVLLTYRAALHAPADEAPSWSLRSSLWVERDGGWQLLFHQGTPSAPSPPR